MIRPSWNRCAFTLVELLVALGIVAAVAGMVVSTTGATARGPLLQNTAEHLAALLRRARAMAIADQAPYSVVFNIQNAPGTSGIVLNNWSGGHSARILRYQPNVVIGNDNASLGTLGPPLLMAGYGPSNQDPWPSGPNAPWRWDQGIGTMAGNAENWPTFAHVVEEIKACQIGEPLYLPARQVRFLALGDSDEGPRVFAGADTAGYGYGPTHPRPWFGWFDSGTGTLHAWGGYDPSQPAVAGLSLAWPSFTNYTGFCYQGAAEAAITDSRHPATRTFTVDWNQDGDTTDSSDPRGPESSWTLYQAGDPRPLVNAAWGDFAIVFERDGTATFPAMKGSRRFYRYDNGAAENVNSVTPTVSTLHGGCGACDQSKTWSFAYNTTTPPGTTATNRFSAPNGESIHYSRHTGRAYITLAPDATQDSNRFANATAALRSMWPMYRVWVHQSGNVGITPVAWEEGVLDRLTSEGRTLWPTSPSVFTMSNVADRNVINQTYRYGWLHSTSTWAPTTWYNLTPAGEPIQDRVSTAMMTRRIWWMNP